MGEGGGGHLADICAIVSSVVKNAYNLYNEYYNMYNCKKNGYLNC